MSYLPLDDRFGDHPKHVDLSAAHLGLIAYSLAYCTLHLTDGIVPAELPGRRFGAQGSQLARSLVARGLWRLTSVGSFEIVGFLDHNPSRAEVLELKEKRSIAGRKGGRPSQSKRKAFALAENNPSASASASASTQGERQASPEPAAGPDEPGRAPPEPAPFEQRASARTNATQDGAFGMLVASWAEGIRSVTRADYRPPCGKPAGELAAQLRRACSGAPDECAVARALGAEYAEAQAGLVLSPFKFADWLGSGRPKRARIGPAEPPPDAPSRRRVAPLPRGVPAPLDIMATGRVAS